MPFTADEIANINNSALEEFVEKGTVFKQNIQNKPLLKAFDDARGSFSGGNQYVSVGVATGQGGGSLVGYSADDQVSYYNATPNKRAKYQWKEHHIGTVVTHTELKDDGIDVTENGTGTSAMDGREAHVLAGLLDSKNEALGEDYAKSLDTLLHGDGTSDTKALAGIRSVLFEDPTTGTTGGINRASNTWWRNFALTNANSSRVTSDPTTGALLQALQKQFRIGTKFAQGGVKWKLFCGTDFYDAIEKELRANGTYTLDGFSKSQAVDGGMNDIQFKGLPIVWDPGMDDISKNKFCYIIDMKRIKLLYMNGQRMKKHTPARPYDRYVMFNGLTTTVVLLASQLNTSGIVEIA